MELEDKQLLDALYKRAIGFDTTEITEEYALGEDENDVKLLKKKVIKKSVPPDLTALKILMGDSEKPIEEMTDEELLEEKQRLLSELLNSQSDNDGE